MLNQVKKVLQNREHAGRLLAEKLFSYKNSNAVIVAVPQGGVPVGYEIAKALHLPFQILFSKRIKHPANSNQSIGAVSLDEVILQEADLQIPQHYLAHQITMLQRSLQQQFDQLYGSQKIQSLENKTVILVDDVLRETDELTACLQSIKKQNPSTIIVAVPVATSKAAHLLINENYKFICLFMEFKAQSKAYTYFPEIKEAEIRALVVDEQMN